MQAFPLINLGAVPTQPPRMPGYAPPQLRRMLGQAPTPGTGLPMRISNEQFDAIKALSKSEEDLADFQDFLKGITANTFERVQAIVMDKVVAELNWLDTYVVGKTDSPEMEKQVKDAWADLAKRASGTAPEWYEKVWGAVKGFLTYLWEEVKKRWEELVDFATTLMAPLLKKYWDMAVHVRRLREDVNKHLTPGEPASGEVAAQETKVLGAESWIATIQGSYAALAYGGSIDALVQGKFGQYPALKGEEPPAELEGAQLGIMGGPAIALTIAGMAGIIIAAYGVVMGIQTLAKEAPWALIGIAGVIALVVTLPMFFGGGD